MKPTPGWKGKKQKTKKAEKRWWLYRFDGYRSVQTQKTEAKKKKINETKIRDAVQNERNRRGKMNKYADNHLILLRWKQKSREKKNVRTWLFKYQQLLGRFSFFLSSTNCDCVLMIDLMKHYSLLRFAQLIITKDIQQSQSQFFNMVGGCHSWRICLSSCGQQR